MGVQFGCCARCFVNTYKIEVFQSKEGIIEIRDHIKEFLMNEAFTGHS